MNVGQGTESAVRTILSIHGIRTTGKWQDDLSEALEKHGFRHRPLNFGFFRTLFLLLPWSREKKIKWFLDEYQLKLGSDSVPPSVIAHSFGTYIIASALQQYDLIRFDRVIFCGSIVRRDFDWSHAVSVGQVNNVLNEAGGRDIWCSLVGWVVADAGPSGVSGFQDTAGGKVLQLEHKSHRHSDYFYKLNYEQRWIPFLQGREIKPSPVRRQPTMNLRFLASVLLILVIIAIGLGWYATTSYRNMEVTSATPSVSVSNNNSGYAAVPPKNEPLSQNRQTASPQPREEFARREVTSNTPDMSHDQITSASVGPKRLEPNLDDQDVLQKALAGTNRSNPNPETSLGDSPAKDQTVRDDSPDTDYSTSPPGELAVKVRKAKMAYFGIGVSNSCMRHCQSKDSKCVHYMRLSSEQQRNARNETIKLDCYLACTPACTSDNPR